MLVDLKFDTFKITKKGSWLNTYGITVFPVISARRLLNFETVRCGPYQRETLNRGGAYYKVREMNNIKCQNFVIFFEEWNIDAHYQ